MDCGKVSTLIEQWSRGAPISEKDALACSEHEKGCPDCCAMHGPVLRLMLRDSGIVTHSSPETWNGNAAGLADAVMAKISATGEKPKRSSGSTSPFPAWRILPLLAAAGLAFFFLVPRDTEIGLVTIRFVIAAPEASTVKLAGDFSDWEGRPMQRRGEGSWELAVPLKKGRTYSYNFIIDDERWVADPESDMTLDDGFGGTVSSLVL